jgi:hypothetical protein
MMVNSYFELNVVRCLDEDKVSNNERIRFHSLVEAKHEMLRISKNPFEFEREEMPRWPGRLIYQNRQKILSAAGSPS